MAERFWAVEAAYQSEFRSSITNIIYNFRIAKTEKSAILVEDSRDINYLKKAFPGPIKHMDNSRWESLHGNEKPEEPEKPEAVEIIKAAEEQLSSIDSGKISKAKKNKNVIFHTV